MPRPSVRLIFLLALSWLPATWACCQTESQRAAVEEMLWNFELPLAQKKIALWPQGIWKSYYTNQVDLYRYISSQRKAERKVYLDSWAASRALLESKAASHPYGEALVADLHLKRALAAFMEEDYWTAISRARDARHWLRLAEKRNPASGEVKKLQGLFSVLFGAVPRRYQWLANTLGFTGNIREGLRLIDASSRESRVLRRESAILAAWAEKQFLNQPEAALSRLEALRRPEAPSQLLDFFCALVYLQMKKNDEALVLLRKRDIYHKNPNTHFIVFWDYLLGKGLYYQERYTEAQAPISRFIRDYEGTLFKGDAALRLGWALTLAGNHSAGKAFFQLIATGEGGFDEDEYARSQAGLLLQKPPGAVETTLMKARNRFDGGYFPEALAHLRTLEPQRASLSPDELAELDYRFGRIFHGQNRLKEADQRYRSCLTFAATRQRWLQAYACFYLGEIERAQGDTASARKWFQQALGYDKIFYQSGLETRCKTALSELKTQ